MVPSRDKLKRWRRLLRQIAANSRLTAEQFDRHGHDELPAPEMAEGWRQTARDLEEIADFLDRA
jgi:hypothetical protein